MATITVTTSSDVVDSNDGVISLREALTLANGAANADTIVFDKMLAGDTVVLTGGVLTLTNTVTISGDTNGDGDADITISGNNASSIIDVASGATATLNSLTLTGGFAQSGSSAITNFGTLSINYSTIAGNSVGTNTFPGTSSATISNLGSLTISQSVFVENTAFGANGLDGTGGIGGDAAAGILNLLTGDVTLDHVAFSGGLAARSGVGGDGADGTSEEPNGVVGGDGGDAALGVLNKGTLSGTAEFSGFGLVEVGQGGHGGTGYSGGSDGAYGNDGQGSFQNLNVNAGSGSTTAVALGTQYADTVQNNILGGTRFDGLGGADSMFGDAFSLLYGGAGNDTLSGGNYGTLNGGLGNDTLTAGLAATARGGAGNDILVNTYVNYGSFYGGAGKDTIDFSNNNYGGYAFDLGAPSFTLFNCVFKEFENANGTQQGDTILGSSGANTINGVEGDDTIEGRGGADKLNGGTGIDTLSYALSGAGVVLSLVNNTASGGDAQGDKISNFENLIGSDLNDTLTGDGGLNLIQGGLGSDTIKGGAGADTLDGGGGTDTLTYTGSLAGVTISLVTGTGTGGDADFDSFTGFENVLGSGQADTLTGNNFANVLQGGVGGDTLSGGGGDDRLEGGDGNDILKGGGGLDTFVMSPFAASRDTIQSFVVADDTLEIKASLFGGGLTAGVDLLATQLVLNATGLSGDADDRFILNTATGELFFDDNGNVAGHHALIATFTGTIPSLTIDDFNIV